MTQAARIALVLAAGGAMMTLGGCETVAEALGTELSANLTGANEVPGPGDPDGAGEFEMEVDTATPQICYDLDVRGIDPATAAHIHRGRAGVAGPPVVTLEPPADGETGGCTSAISRELTAEMLANPSGFYVNVHNSAFPDGAIRGQLINLPN